MVCRDTFQLIECDDVFAVGQVSSVMATDVYSTAAMIQVIPAVTSTVLRVADALAVARGWTPLPSPRSSSSSSSPSNPAASANAKSASARRLLSRVSSSSGAPSATTTTTTTADAYSSLPPSNSALLFESLRSKDWAKAAALISKSEGLSFVDSTFGMGVLHMAVTVNAPVRVVNALLQKGCDPNQRDGINSTPVHVASSRNVDGAVLEALLDAGGDPNVVADDGLTPVQLAAQTNAAPNVLRALLDAGGVALRPRDADGATAVWLAASKNASPRLVKMLLDAGADVDAPASDGTTPLWMACSRNASPTLVKALVEAGASLTSRNAAGISPLGAALQAKAPVALVRALLEGNGSVDLAKHREAGATKRLTPLMLAVDAGCSFEVVEYLLGRGADASLGLKDADGRTAEQRLDGKRGEHADRLRRLFSSSNSVR